MLSVASDDAAVASSVEVFVPIYAANAATDVTFAARATADTTFATRAATDVTFDDQTETTTETDTDAR